MNFELKAKDNSDSAHFRELIRGLTIMITQMRSEIDSLKWQLDGLRARESRRIYWNNILTNYRDPPNAD